MATYCTLCGSFVFAEGKTIPHAMWFVRFCRGQNHSAQEDGFPVQFFQHKQNISPAVLSPIAKKQNKIMAYPIGSPPFFLEPVRRFLKEQRTESIFQAQVYTLWYFWVFVIIAVVNLWVCCSYRSSKKENLKECSRIDGGIQKIRDDMDSAIFQSDAGPGFKEEYEREQRRKREKEEKKKGKFRSDVGGKGVEQAENPN